MTQATMPLCQVALSVQDLDRSVRWYQRALGLLDAGGTDRFRGSEYEQLIGMAGAATRTGWLVDQQDWFQWEFFQFEPSIQVRPKPADWSPRDIGYTLFALHVVDFDAALARVRACSGRFLTEPIGPPGARRVCLEDPDGVLLELMEDDPRAPDARARPWSDCPAVTRAVRASVPDLDVARRFWVDALGLRPAEDVVLHTDEHESLWGLGGESPERLLLWAGDFLVELVEFRDPRGRHWPAGHQISDQGIENIALGSRRKEDHDAVWAATDAGGYRGFRAEPWQLGFAGVIYVNDDQGFNVELMWCREEAEHSVGFEPIDPGLGGVAWQRRPDLEGGAPG